MHASQKSAIIDVLFIMRTIQDERLSKAIMENMTESPFFEYVERVLDVLKGHKVYLWGGAVRDPIVKELYTLNYETRDFDINVDDSKHELDFRRLFYGFEGMFYSRHGTPKWKPINGLEIDVGPFSAATVYKRQPLLPIDLETSLASVDISTSAIAYDLGTGTVYSEQAWEGIERKEVDVLHQYGEEPSVIMCRLVLHGHKLSFDVGQMGRKFVADNYSPAHDGYIRRYLAYKGKEGLSHLVFERLKHIQEEDSP